MNCQYRWLSILIITCLISISCAYISKSAAFANAFDRVEIGMTSEQVENTLKKYQARGEPIPREGKGVRQYREKSISGGYRYAVIEFQDNQVVFKYISQFIWPADFWPDS